MMTYQPWLERQPVGLGHLRTAPLSPAQEGLWLLDRLGLAGPAYNVPVILRARGPLDADALEKSLADLVRRHEALRTRFTERHGRGVQLVLPPDEFQLRRMDVSGAGLLRQEYANEIVRTEMQTPFDLLRGPLFRATLIRFADDDYVIVLLMHHIICDERSLEILFRELSALYGAHVDGRAVALAAPSHQYADFAEQQRLLLPEHAIDGHIEFWRGALANAPDLILLPTDHTRPSVATHHGAMCSFDIDATDVRRAESLCRQQEVSLFMLLLSVYQLLLARWSGTDDVVVGAPVAGRTQLIAQNVVGNFVNALPLRAKLDFRRSYCELLQAVKTGVLDAYAHQDAPFGRVVAELKPPRDLSHHPVFQTWFVLQETARHPLHLDGLAVESIRPTEHVTSKFDLAMFVARTAQGLRGSIEYSTDLFDRGTIARFASYFGNLLTQVLEHPEWPLWRYELPTNPERRRVLVEWNSTERSVPQHLVHETIAQRAQQAPDTVAVTCGEAQLTYGELDARANRLARYLRSLGVGPDVVVGLCLERSLDAIVALLGIWKAGGAYLPLDPADPSERLAFMLANADVPVLVTRSDLVERLPVRGPRLILLDAAWPAVDQFASTAPDVAVLQGNLAYVIYTSGSTGKPKGTLLHHGGLANMLDSAALELGVTPEDRVLQFSRLTFDASTFEVVIALMVGAALCIGPSHRAMSREALNDLMVRQRVSVAVLPPATLSLLDKNQCCTLRMLLVAGDACPVELAREWSVGRRFLNLYGPTEDTIWATFFEYDGASVLPIGRPIGNTQLFVLDEFLQPAALGAVGELYIAGPALARGYLRNPALTAERFIANPFGYPGSRMYRTGDLVRYDADGNLLFVGRSDRQIKLRGFRIELGEVEATLLRHPSVAEAVIDVSADEGFHRKLCAYIVPRAGAHLDIEELRQYASSSLPSFMVPAAFCALAAMPLTRHGKLDRKALACAVQVPVERSPSLSTAGSTTEIALCAIWKDTLKVEVGVADNFFEIGGDSLSAMTMISKARQKLGVTIPLKLVFEAPTIAQIAKQLDGSEHERR